MEFEWDENKRSEVLDKHAVDFRHAALIFEGPILTKVDKRLDYGEGRNVSVLPMVSASSWFTRCEMV